MRPSMKVFGIFTIFLQSFIATGQGQVTTRLRILEHPEDHYVADGKPVSLNCQVDLSPQEVTITWYKDGQALAMAADSPGSDRLLLPSGQLLILSVESKGEKSDLGTYYCNVTDKLSGKSVISKNATLRLATLGDGFRQQPSNTEVAIGDTAVLDCRVPRGRPEPHISWRKDGETLELSDRVSATEQGSLRLQDTRKQDSGFYTCIASNAAGERSSEPAHLLVLERPQFKVAPQTRQVQENQNATFQCEASGDPPPTIIWSKENGQVPESRSRIFPDKSLHIEHVEASDAGIYVCRAENSIGFVEAKAELQIHAQPTFIITPRDKTVGLGRRVSFQCQVTGNPPPAIFWSKENSQENLFFPGMASNGIQVEEDGTLVIQSARKEDEGDYVCQVVSLAGRGQARANLEVQEIDPRPPPIIYQGPQNQTLPTNSEVMLPCSATGDPLPTVSWLRDDQPLPPNDPRITMLSSGMLQISALRASDSGVYTCTARSETGTTTWSAPLQVKSPSDPANVFRRAPEPTTFPGAPSKPQVEEKGDTFVRLSWKSNPNHGASPVEAYIVEYYSYEVTENWVTASSDIRGLAYTVTNLQPDKSYIFLVRARNSHGLSLPSKLTSLIKTLAVEESGLKQLKEELDKAIIEVDKPKVLSPIAVQVTWKVRQSSQLVEGVNIHYHVVGEEGHLPPVTVIPITMTTKVLGNLRKFTRYQICVRPYGGGVDSVVRSSCEDTRTLPDVPSAAPQNIQAKMENTTLYINWQSIPEEHCNGVISNYSIYLYSHNGDIPRRFVTNATTTSVVIHNLTPNIAYTVQLAATNEIGEGNKSAPIVIGDALQKPIIQSWWFIGPIIGLGALLAIIILCFFSVWLWRKKRDKHHGAFKGKEREREAHVSQPLLGTYPQPILSNGHYVNANGNNMAKPSAYPTIYSHMQGFQHHPSDSQDGQMMPYTEHLDQGNQKAVAMKSFYNKTGNMMNSGPATPYATTALLQQQHQLIEFMPVEGCEQCLLQSPVHNDCDMHDYQLYGTRPPFPLPAPPSHPPPCNDMGSPPSPATAYSSHGYSSHSPYYHVLPGRGGSGSLRGNSPHSSTGMRNSSRSTLDGGYQPIGPHAVPYMTGSNIRTNPHTGHNVPTTTAGMETPLRAYSPRAMSEPDRGPTPPIRQYKLPPVSTSDKHYSDTEGAPTPPRRLMSAHGAGEAPPSPAPPDDMDPTMDRGIQSSLPSLAQDGYQGDCRPTPSISEVGQLESDMDGGRMSPYSNCDETTAASTLGAWHSGGESSNSSMNSSGEESEQDFNNELARVAERFGTVLADHQHDKAKKIPKSRPHRPVSPYSTDSNYSSIPRHQPYPRAHRRHQHHEQDAPVTNGLTRNSSQNNSHSNQMGFRPPVSTKPWTKATMVPAHVAELPSYHKPTSPSSNTTNAPNIRTNPLAALDTGNITAPIV